MPGAYSNLGFAYGAKSEWDKAITELTEAIRLDPKYSVAHSTLGMAYQGKGEWGKAIAELTEAVRLDPKIARSHLNLGTMYGRLMGEYDKAIAELY